MYHTNFTFENFTIYIVLHWLPLLKGYGPNIKYTIGRDNDALDALSRLMLIKYDVKESNINR